MGGGDRGKRYGPSRRLTRRRFIGGAMSLGGGALLAACGATATPQADAIVVSTPAAASATRTVGVPGTPTLAPASAGTASPTLAATPTINGASATELGRLLGLLPQTESLPGRTGIWFADVARQKRNYGYERLTSIEAVRALPGGVVAFSNAVGKLPLPTEAGIDRLGDPQWWATVGYDFWQIARTISGGDPPRTWARLEGTFDRAGIEATLLGQGYARVPYGDRAYLSRLADGEVRLSDPLGRLVLNRLNRVAIEEGALTSAPFTAAIEAGIDAVALRRPTFAADPDYAALALALGPIVGAVLTTPDGLYRPSGPQVRGATPVATRLATPARARLHPYRLVGLGLRDDGTTHTMLVALVYENAAEAQADAPILRQRAEDYTLLRNGQRLRERARLGEPEIVAAGARTVLIQPFAIAAEADLSLYLQLYTTRDLLFLAE